MKDIFDVQDEITLSVVDALKLKLIGTEKALVLKRYTESVEAYELYLKGRYHWWKTAPEEFVKGREFFERAVEVDPNYALSYAGLSSYYGFGAAFGMVPLEVGWPKAVAANQRALELDDTLAEVHVNEGGINMVYRRDFDAAEKNIKRSLELNPRFQEAHFIYSDFLLTRGRFDEGIAEARHAVALDPFSPRLLNHLGLGYCLLRRYAEALGPLRQAVELDPSNPLLHDSLGDALLASGMHSEAVAQWQKGLECVGAGAQAEQLKRVFADSDIEKTVKHLSQMRLENLSARRTQGEYVPEIHFVRALIGVGDSEGAMARLEKACEERNVFTLRLHADPFYERFKADSRFQEILRRTNLLPKGESDEVRRAVATAGQTDREKTSVGNDETQKTAPRNITTRSILIALLAVVFLGVAVYAYWSRTHSSLAAKSIAVLPFKNESGNSELEYLSDGMTDSLINSLSQLPQVTVKAHDSVFRYKNVNTDPQRIGSELSVEAILNGRVVQRGDDLTLFLWLVDARNGNQVWGEQYNRKASDLVSLQREIARDVSEKLRVKLSATTAQRVVKDYTSNAEAYRLYLRGRFHILKLTPPEAQQGIADFQSAIEADPNYALAYVGLSEGYRTLALGSEMPPKEYLGRAKLAAQQALQLDDELPEAHTALGSTVFWLERNWPEAENQYRRALELNPNATYAHLFYAHLLANTARHDEARVEIKRAADLDPLSPLIGALTGQFLLHAGRTDEALSKLKETSLLAPDFWFPHLFASSAYIEKGMYSEAISEARRASELSKFQTNSAAYEAFALAKMGKRDEARAILDRLIKLSEQRFVPPYHIALIYNGLGDKEQTFTWLERSLEVGDSRLTFLKVEPKWNNLRTDPKFQDLMRRAGF